jgi:uncharacterized protein (TIGR02271 family)
MFDRQEAQQLIGADLYGASDQKVGRIGQVYLDDETGMTEWATVNTGFFGTSESFVPLQGAQRVSSGVAVPFDKDQIKNAPRVEASDGHIEEGQEAELYRYYGLAYSEDRSDTGLPEGAPDAATTAGEEGLVRSEEQLHVGKERVQTGSVRLRKYVVTEEENVTVPVQKERVRLETEPLSGEGARLGDEISEGETEVTLSEERPVVHKETVAKEKVGLVKDVREEQQTISEDVRKEQIEVQGDVDGPAGR